MLILQAINTLGGRGSDHKRLLIHNGFSQLVDTPTRRNNILDVFATNRPSLISKCNIIPGISDHEAVHVKTHLRVPIVQPAPRQVIFWDKADFQHINDLMLQHQNFYLHYSLHTPIKQL